MKPINKLLILALLLLNCCVESEDVSSLKLPNEEEKLEALLEQNPSDEEKIRIYDALSLVNEGKKIDKAIYYLDVLIPIAERNNLKKQSGNAYYNRGLLLIKQNNYLDALSSFLASVEWYNKAGETLKVGNALNNLGVIFMDIGNYSYAIHFLTKAEKIFEEEGSLVTMVNANRNLGVCYYSQKEPNYELAEEHFAKAKLYIPQLDKDRDYYYNVVYNSKGAMNYKSKHYSEAIRNYKLSMLHTNGLSNAETKKAIAYLNIGEAYIGLGRYSEAELWLSKVMIVAKHLDKSLEVEMHNIYGKLYQKQGNHEKALQMLEKAIQLADKASINVFLQEAISLSTKSYMHLRENKVGIDGSKVVDIMAHSDEQNRLRKAFYESGKIKGLQEALSKQITISDLENKLGAANTSKQNTATLAKTMALIAVILLAVAAFNFQRMRTMSYNINSTAQSAIDFAKGLDNDDNLTKGKQPKARGISNLYAKLKKQERH